MKDAILYMHGKGGCAAESRHYKSLFPDHAVIGLDYQTFTPWETGAEIRSAVAELNAEYARIILIANSIGAYFSMCAGIDRSISEAFFISPIVDMEKLICEMMRWASVTEAELKENGVIHTAPTQILYGSRDTLTSPDVIRDFANTHNRSLTILEGGEHWFHTEAQMAFLDNWILKHTGVAVTWMQNCFHKRSSNS